MGRLSIKLGKFSRTTTRLLLCHKSHSTYQKNSFPRYDVLRKNSHKKCGLRQRSTGIAKAKSAKRKAAQIAGYSREDFLTELGRQKIDVIPVDLDALKDELDRGDPRRASDA